MEHVLTYLLKQICPILICIFGSVLHLCAQEPSAIMELESTTQGFLLPRMTTAQIDAIDNPAVGLQVFNTESGCVQRYAGDMWVSDCGTNYEGDVILPPMGTSWASSMDFPGTPRNYAVSFTIGHNAYVGTGYDAIGPYTNDFFKFNAATNTWDTIAFLPGIEREGAVAFTINNIGYVGSGWNGSSGTSDFCKYDAITNVWDLIAPYPGGTRYFAVAFTIGAEAYVGMGYQGGYKKDFYKYDPNTDMWTAIADFPGMGRNSAVAFTMDGKAYVGSGLAGANLKDFYEYDPIMDTWTAIADIPGTGQNSSVAFVLDNKAYVGTGNDGAATTDFYSYDHINDSWDTVASFPGVARWGSFAFTLGNSGYVGTGYGGGYKKDMFKFDFDDYVPVIDAFGLSSFVPLATFQTIGSHILDTDNDTKVEVEMTEDEDNIVFVADGTEAMRILADGKVGLGVSPLYPLQLASGARCTGSGTWTNASDRRLKKDISPLSYGLNEVLQLNPVSYQMRINNNQEIGFIAQDVQKIVPEVVSGFEGDLSKGETLGISYGNLTPVLVKAIQEQQKIIDALRIENEAQQVKLDEMASLENRISSLEKILITSTTVDLEKTTNSKK